jgi:hypothetical protein
MKYMSLVLVMSLVAVSAEAQTNTSWDGIWNGSWGGLTAARIIIAGGRVVEYDYRGTPQRFGVTTLSADGLSFGTPPDFVVTLTRTGEATASAHYHGPGGEADAQLQGNECRDRFVPASVGRASLLDAGAIIRCAVQIR